MQKEREQQALREAEKRRNYELKQEQLRKEEEERQAAEAKARWLERINIEQQQKDEEERLAKLAQREVELEQWKIEREKRL